MLSCVRRFNQATILAPGHKNGQGTKDPMFTDAVLVGNIDDTATFSKMGSGLNGPEGEMFFVSGVYAKNMWGNPVMSGCGGMKCTVRYEGAVFVNSTTRSGPAKNGLIWDLDGTMTGYPHGFVVPYGDLLAADPACHKHGPSEPKLRPGLC